MAFRLLLGCTSFRAESEQNCSRPGATSFVQATLKRDFLDAPFNAAQLIRTDAGAYNYNKLAVRYGAISRLKQAATSQLDT